MKAAPWYLYILECKTRKLYTGITNDVDRRLKMHKEGTGARFTRANGVKGVVYTEKCGSMKDARKRECEIKKLSRNQKILLFKNEKRK